tara:strand:- start:1267 stop:2088 length:822 start_codon:yes stop_codon:yes gene_type:complete
MEPQDEMKEVLNEDVIKTQKEQVQAIFHDGQKSQQDLDDSYKEEGRDLEEEKAHEEEIKEQSRKPKRSMEERTKELRRQTWEAREEQRKVKKMTEEADAKMEELRKYHAEVNPDEEPPVESRPVRSDEQIVKEFNEKKKQKEISLNWEMAREDAIDDDPLFPQKEARIAETLKNYSNVDLVNGILSADKPIELVNYLDANAEELVKIAQLSPPSAFRELWKLEQKLGQEKPKPRQSNAPKPITPVKASGSPKDRNSMSQAEYDRYRNKQEFGY